MNVLPEILQDAIEDEVSRAPRDELIKSCKELIETYRQNKNTNFLKNSIHAHAYLAMRFTPIYSVLKKIFENLTSLELDYSFNTLLDLGAGPATATLAAADVFPNLNKATLVEKNEHLIAIGKNLFHTLGNQAFQKSEWSHTDLKTFQPAAHHDVSIFSYSLGELTPYDRENILKKVWEKTDQLLLIVEPGTPLGYKNMLLARKQAIDMGAHVYLPCPHNLTCPLDDGKNWCHFSVRTNRSSYQKAAKEGLLGYEDEKYSYVVLGRKPVLHSERRILNCPLKRSGHIHMNLCTQEGLKEVVISKKDPLYKKAKRLKWGDSI